jgi:hypothetical protein
MLKGTEREMTSKACLCAMAVSLFLAGPAQSAGASDPALGAACSEEMAWSLGWNISLAVVGQAQGSPPETTKALRETAERIAREWAIPLPPFPIPAEDRTKKNVDAVSYILRSARKPIGTAVHDRFDKRHAALFDVGIKLPLLVFLYAPGDEVGRATRQGVADAASLAKLPPALFAGLFEKVDGAAPWTEIRDEVAALGRGVPGFLRTQSAGPFDTEIATRKAAWQLGENLSLAVLGETQDMPQDLVQDAYRRAEAGARRLGLEPPPRLHLRPDSRSPVVAAYEYLLRERGPAVAEQISARHGARHGSLFELALKLPVLNSVYLKDVSGTARRLVGEIRRAADEAGVPQSSLSGLEALVQRGADEGEVRSEVIRVLGVIGESLSSR